MIAVHQSDTLIPTEPIGSIPRPPELIAAQAAFESGRISQADLERMYDGAVRDTLQRFEDTGSPVVTDGEQRKFHNFATYALHGSPILGANGFVLQFASHARQFPAINRGPFRYERRADSFVAHASKLTSRPLKQAVIAPSAISLMYPAQELPDYPREQFIDDLVAQHLTEVLACLQQGAYVVQIDFTEARLACKLDPSGQLLNSFIHLNNMALDRLDATQRARIGIHTCPGGDCDSTHSADVDYAELLPTLFELNATHFYIALAREPNRARVLTMIRKYLKPHQRAFVGVIDPLTATVETPEQVRERVLEAAEFIPLQQLGTTDDCGFAPFSDDISTSRDTAFAKIAARVAGTAMAAAELAKHSA